MARLPIPGSDDNTWGDVLNEFLSVEHNDDGTQKTLDIAKGGTGATDAATARTNLGVAASSHTHIASNVTDFSEAVDDRVNDLLVAGDSIALTYDDNANNLTISVAGQVVASVAAGTFISVDNTDPDNPIVSATRDLTVITEASGSRTLALSDANAYIRLTNNSSCDVTVPDNNDVALPVGTQILLRAAGAGTYTIVEDTAVTVNPPAGGSLVLAGDATLVKVSTDEWDLIGATV